MLVYLGELLRDQVSWFNLLRYVSFRVMGAFVFSLLICLVFYPRFIRMLQQKAIGQPIRDDGPANHFSKQGTPTAGGILIMVAIWLSCLLWCNLSNLLVLVTLFAGLVFAAIGLWDDLRKVRRKSSKGLSGKVRLVIEFAVVLAVFGYFLYGPGHGLRYDLRLYVPFVSAERFWLDLPFWAYLVLGAFVVVGTANATNLTDGLDGLAAGPILTASGTLLILTYITGAKLGSFDISRYLLIPKVTGAEELSVVCSAMMGATIGFLWFNTFPAEIFMGDTGALGLGAQLGAMALLTKNELLSVVIFGVFFFEAISDIIQTTYFKLTGKRIFPMAPIHHSLEKIGWPEPKIVVRFWILSLLLSMVALASIKVR